MTRIGQTNLILIGYRGSGKTTVGRWLAKRLGVPFVDTDAEVAGRAGMTLAEIFAAEGEEGFRRREAEVVGGVLDRDGQVVSVGGGAVLHDDNVRRLRQRGVVIWLTAEPEVLWSRIQRDAASSANRPPLSSEPGLTQVRAILAQREPRYRSVADAVVSASSDDIEQVGAAVLEAYERVASSSADGASGCGA